MTTRVSVLAAALSAFLVLPGQPATAAGGDFAALEKALQLDEIFAVMREEGIAYGEEVAADLFPGPAGATWDREVSRIYDTGRVLPVFRDRFEARLEDAGADVPAMIDFFSSDLGRKVTTLELSARRALLDDAVEEASRLTYDKLRMESDPLLLRVDAFVEANDLVEANVTGAMNANLAFYGGLGDAGVLGPEVSEAEILSRVWAQEPDIRNETEEWIYSYLVMAYAPLSQAELDAYTDFSRTEAGRALNTALFAGFDEVFVDVSRQLGRAAGTELTGQDL